MSINDTQIDRPGDALTLEQAMEKLAALESKHADLMWLARSAPPDDVSWLSVRDDIKRGAWASQAKIMQQYPEETGNLACPEHGGWHHGFNSGVVAAIRYLWELQEMGEEHAESMFPDLYT